MRIWQTYWVRAILVAILSLLARTPSVVAAVDATADNTLTYETIEPARIQLGDSAQIRVTTFYGYLRNISLPSVPGLEFEVAGRSEGLDFINGKSVPATFILIRVTPKFAGVFTIPGLTPGAKSLGLEVVTGNEPNPYAFRNPDRPKPKPVAAAPIPKGVQLKAGGAAFVQLIIPKRAIYVGESVPIDIEVGIRPGIVTSFNGPPTLTSSDFTLNDLSRQPIRREQVIEGNSFEILTWHTLLAAVKPGDFSLSVEAPLSVRDAQSAEDSAIAARLGWPFAQIMYNKKPPKDVKVPSPASELKVSPLPPGQPADFSGAVGDFQVTSDISPAEGAVGEPLTLRLHISGAGNFDRVNSSLLEHLDHWKTYPVKSAFTPRNALGYSGEKVFEQPLIAQTSGEQLIPALQFSYFNPRTQQYERTSTQPIRVNIAASMEALARNRGGASTGPPVPQGLRDDPIAFFDLAREVLLQAFSVRWQISAEQITGAELQARLGSTGREVERLFALADEAKYSSYRPEPGDFQHWIALIQSQIATVDK